MSEKIPTREEALALLKKYNQTESLRKHALAVEGVMRYFARKRNEDEEKWGIVGLLHDFDYQRWPDPPDHPLRGAEILTEGNRVIGVRMGDMGIDKEGKPKANYQPGMDIFAKITVLGEGVRGTLTKQLVDGFEVVLLRGGGGQRRADGVHQRRGGRTGRLVDHAGHQRYC